MSGTARQGTTGGSLACCHGFSVAAGEGRIGSIETPLFTGAAAEPDYLIVRTAAGIPGTFRAVPASLVGEVDPVRCLVVLHAERREILALPERLPLERR